MRFLLLIAILLDVSLIGFSQVKSINETNSDSIESLISNRNIVFIKSDQYKIQVLECMLFYPGLIYRKIYLKTGKIKTTMATRPKFSSIFRSKKKRNYVIIINDDSTIIKEVLLQNIPYCAQIGVIGHEIAHIYDFTQKSALQIISTGIKYVFRKKRRNFEHQIDSITIAHNLGRELFTFADFILNKSNVNANYKVYKSYIYMKPDEIEKQIDKHKLTGY
jgi:hypothetical protein